MADYRLFCESILRGYHAYKNIKITLGQLLICQQEPENEYDQFAVVVKTKQEETVGHLPIEILKRVQKFLNEGGEVEAEVIGSRFNDGLGKGLEVPLDIKFIGWRLYIKKLRKTLIEKYGRNMVTVVALDSHGSK